ncbi:MAG: hypothetical protein G01um101417_49 [Parcubacteria group bacterium Gr01-1014_17]|nr:MAG: hypothetical protein G01um101417_49 [Parcubacteria group bacterium Gr01-1014_17]
MSAIVASLFSDAAFAILLRALVFNNREKCAALVVYGNKFFHFEIDALLPRRLGNKFFVFSDEFYIQHIMNNDTIKKCRPLP